MLSTEQVPSLQNMWALLVVMEPPGPVASEIMANTFVPAQTGTLLTVELSEFGSTMFPQIDCETFGLFDGL